MQCKQARKQLHESSASAHGALDDAGCMQCSGWIWMEGCTCHVVLVVFRFYSCLWYVSALFPMLAEGSNLASGALAPHSGVGPCKSKSAVPQTCRRDDRTHEGSSNKMGMLVHVTSSTLSASLFRCAGFGCGSTLPERRSSGEK